ncbi:hypothetical protein J4233_05535 [Candidatus Pacearchaeota archaeon]|nr:hypothetical protein [uncultured archaeon]AQS28903.1 hypothetical protein [uncultured archaeon]MBS3077701.1 hypothetical protein [Candidatus Pacearchaeota archaeon]
MTITIDDFVKSGKEADKFDEAVGKVGSNNVDEADAARVVFGKSFKDIYGAGVPLPDFDDQNQVRPARAGVRRAYQDRYISYMRDVATRDGLLRQIPDSKLSELVLHSPALKTGDATRDAIVDAHTKVVKYDEKIAKASKDYRSAVDEIVDTVYNNVKNKLTADSRNTLLTPEEIENNARTIANLARNPNYGIRMLSGLRDEAEKKFDGLLDPSNEAARAAYVREGYVALSTKGATPDEIRQNQFSAAKSLQGLATA